MNSASIERVRALAREVGIDVADEDMTEVANRLDSLLGEMAGLAGLDLTGITPLPVFPDEDPDGQ
jgi:hypothetical protein